MFIKGNLDAVNVIMSGTPEKIVSEARHCIEAAGSGGGYILSSACSIPPHTPTANISLLTEAADRYGVF
jgi:uroporphyrinogen decarboxylase